MNQEECSLNKQSIDAEPLISNNKDMDDVCEPESPHMSTEECTGYEQTRADEQVRKVPINLPTVPDEWQLNHFLDDIAEAITDRELARLKNLFSGEI